MTISDAVSSTVFPYGGIPQGTRLAPILFAILINRLVRDYTKIWFNNGVDNVI